MFDLRVIRRRSASLFCAVAVAACASRGRGDGCQQELLFDSDQSGRPDVYVLPDAGAPKLLSRSEEAGDYSRVPDWSPDRRRIVVQGRRGGTDGLFLISCQGGNAVHVPNTSGAGAPAWSPDGHRLAFVKDARIHTVDLRSGVVKAVPALPDSSFYPAWSPDGSALAFVAKGALTWEIFVMVADGSVHQLTEAQSADAPSQGPAWSPDGRRLAFDRKRGNEFHIFVTNADGTATAQLTHGPAVHARPAWSPDGRSIVFHGTRDRPEGAPADDRRYFELYVMSLDGRNMRRLTTNDDFDGHPDWW